MDVFMASIFREAVLCQRYFPEDGITGMKTALKAMLLF
jgi:hypothetical protein